MSNDVDHEATSDEASAEPQNSGESDRSGGIRLPWRKTPAQQEPAALHASHEGGGDAPLGARLRATTALQPVTPMSDSAPGEPEDGTDDEGDPSAAMTDDDGSPVAMEDGDALARREPVAQQMSPLKAAVGQDWIPEAAGVGEDVADRNGAIGEYVAASTKRLSRGLGRGLAALLDDTGEAAAHEEPASDDESAATRSVPVDRLSPGRYQPRRSFDETQLEELAQSMRQNGMLMPILARPAEDHAGHYEVVAGERRWRAAQRAGLAAVPVIVRELSDTQALEMALIENIQRRDLTPLEEAQGYRRLMDGFGHTQEALADTVGKSRSHVANMLRLLNLPEDVQEMLQDGRLSAGHGRALVSTDDPSTLAARVVADGLNVRETERLAQAAAEGAVVAEPDDALEPPGAEETELLARQLSQDLGLKVTIKRRGERGSVKISFTSLDQFADLVRRLRDGPTTSDAGVPDDDPEMPDDNLEIPDDTAYV